MPGPLTAAAIVKGQSSGKAGALIALGHGLIEVPLIIAISAGLSAIFQWPIWKLSIGVIGGSALVWMGVGMIKDRAALSEGVKTIPYGSFHAGILTTASNPYFYIWWATVGAALITKSLSWGIAGVLLFIPAHWSVDLIWVSMLSFMSHRGNKLMSVKAQATVLAICGIVLASFGIYFIIDGSGLLQKIAGIFAFIEHRHFSAAYIVITANISS